MFSAFGGNVLASAPLVAAILTLLALSWGALASGAGALLLTAGPAVLVAVLVWILLQVAAWRLLSGWASFPWWWAWVPAVCAGAGVATWWRRTGQTVEGLRAGLIETQRASVTFVAGLVVDGHPAPLALGQYVYGTLPLALVVGTLAVASLDAWCRLDDHMERRRLLAEQRAAAARQQEALRQQEDVRRREAEQLRHEALRHEQERHRQPHEEPQRVPAMVHTSPQPAVVAPAPPPAAPSAPPDREPSQEPTREASVAVVPASVPTPIRTVWEAFTIVPRREEVEDGEPVS